MSFNCMMQSAFVLCRLFKKQDESIEVSNCDEVEPSDSSPISAKSCPQSDFGVDQTSQVLENDSEMKPTHIGCSVSYLPDKTTSNAQALVECQSKISNAYAEDQVTEEVTTTTEVRTKGQISFCFYFSTFSTMRNAFV